MFAGLGLRAEFSWEMGAHHGTIHAAAGLPYLSRLFLSCHLQNSWDAHCRRVAYVQGTCICTHGIPLQSTMDMPRPISRARLRTLYT